MQNCHLVASQQSYRLSRKTCCDYQLTQIPPTKLQLSALESGIWVECGTTKPVDKRDKTDFNFRVVCHQQFHNKQHNHCFKAIMQVNLH